ncbi:hypothetical protein HPP92_011334 [Vanilla planifolia]|uniref:Uncharacterized protein n=1 Tax=Vanilla planifolia TaxID=51239 RepID=A0A835V4B9_VANPL|nr:hypothetical protein HPP92_011334 [Vanilla planifolia]
MSLVKHTQTSFDKLRKTHVFIKSARETYGERPATFWIQLAISSSFMLVAFPASSILSRLYFTDGGKSKWIVSWVAVAGWPLTALFLTPAYVLGKVSPSPLPLLLCLLLLHWLFLLFLDSLL